ncbi:phospholipid N-methyltransferase [Evansella vedderi]|uniref:Phospholipid N-methyltransferase n=1 Tax=Evansella vedderi TaxID=38282 RepID=A0ABT9ZXV7_9BACI|nr:rRNA adenine N-6-methyltransferase family protein [Evansella vedderi]MDQ0256069.1 phospholipid N-methyltransferase [Evansella vedderi]
MKRQLFLAEYIQHPATVGAVMPSSKYLAKKVIDDIDFNQAEYIVEYGPGTGIFTEKILAKRKENTIVLLVELSKEFYQTLKEKYEGEENLYIVNGSAENIDWYLRKFNIPKVDYVVSGLPFTTLPKVTSSEILNKTKSILKDEGTFITFQYTLFRKKLFQSAFEHIEVKRELRNVPPAFVLSCSNPRSS